MGSKYKFADKSIQGNNSESRWEGIWWMCERAVKKSSFFQLKSSKNGIAEKIEIHTINDMAMGSYDHT